MGTFFSFLTKNLVFPTGPETEVFFRVASGFAPGAVGGSHLPVCLQVIPSPHSAGAFDPGGHPQRPSGDGVVSD